MNEETAKKGMSTGAKWGIGCGAGCLVILFIVAAIGIFGFRFARSKLAEMTDEFTKLGFAKVVQGQVEEVQETITEPTLFMAQSVKIRGNCTTNLAILAQVAEIYGTVQGKVYFRGQMLVVQPDAKLLGGLDVTCQVIQKFGTIEGGVTGTYQALDDKSATPSPASRPE